MQALDHKITHKEILRKELLDESFTKLKNELKLQREAEKDKIEMIILELANDVIEEYLKFLQISPESAFKTLRRFDVKINNKYLEILLKPDFWVRLKIFRIMLKTIFIERHFDNVKINSDVNVEKTIDDIIVKKTVDFTFSFPTLEQML